MIPHTYSFGREFKKSNKSVQRSLNADYHPSTPPYLENTNFYKKSVISTVHCSMKHSNCYMVWGGDLVSNHQTRFSQEDMVIGCLVDLATGLMTFTANGKEINTFYQVRKDGFWL